MNYLELVKDIRFPDPKQTIAFITWLADAHSWYKHLSRDGEDFFLFLDPYAGLDSEGNVLEGGGSHYNYRTTKQWREQHGFWSYSRGEPVCINPGEEIYVPKALAHQGRVRLYPSVHGASILDMTFEARFHPKDVEYHQHLQQERWLQFQWMKLAADKFLTRLRSKLDIDPRED
jgi:hypothetical protein